MKPILSIKKLIPNLNYNRLRFFQINHNLLNFKNINYEDIVEKFVNDKFKDKKIIIIKREKYLNDLKLYSLTDNSNKKETSRFGRSFIKGNFENVTCLKSFENSIKCVQKELDLDEKKAKFLLVSLMGYRSSSDIIEDNLDLIYSEMEKKLFLLKQYFTNEQIFYNFNITIFKYFILFNRLEILKEIGFKNFEPEYIINFQHIFNMTPNILQNSRFVDFEIDIFQKLVSVFDDLNDYDKDIYFSNTIKNSNNIPIKELYIKLIEKYLTFRIKGKPKLNKFIKDFSLPRLKNVKLILDYIENEPDGIPLFTARQTKNLGFRDWTLLILTQYEILSEIDDYYDKKLFGRNLKNIFLICPNFLLGTKNFHDKIELLTKSYKIKDDHILKNIQVVTLNFKVLQNRLNFWIDKFGKRCLKNESLLLLLRNHGKGVELLNILENNFRELSIEPDFKTFELDLFFRCFFRTKSYFKFYSKSFSGENKKILFKISESLNIDYNVLACKIKEHPDYKNLNPENSLKVFDFLQNEIKVDNEYILKSIFIILYDYEEVKNMFYKIKEENVNKEIKMEFILNLIVWNLDKKSE